MFSVHRKMFLALKKVWIIKILVKNPPQGKFPVPYPLQLFGKPWRCYGIMCTAFDIAILYILNKYMMKMTLMMMMTQLPINSGYQSIGQP